MQYTHDSIYNGCMVDTHHTRPTADPRGNTWLESTHTHSRATAEGCWARRRIASLVPDVGKKGERDGQRRRLPVVSATVREHGNIPSLPCRVGRHSCRNCYRRRYRHLRHHR